MWRQFSGICRHFRHCSSSLPILQQPICAIPLGTWVPKIGEPNGRPLAMLRPNASMSAALSLLIQGYIILFPYCSISIECSLNEDFLNFNQLFFNPYLYFALFLNVRICAYLGFRSLTEHAFLLLWMNFVICPLIDLVGFRFWRRYHVSGSLMVFSPLIF